MATRYWAGVGGSLGSWDTTPVAGDIAVFTDTAQDVTADFDALKLIDLAAVIFTDTFRGRVGNEQQGFELECANSGDGYVVNFSRSPFIHLKAGDTENINRILHAPRGNGAELLLSNPSVGSLQCTAGSCTVGGDATMTAGYFGGTAFVKILEGSVTGTGAVEAFGRSQVDLYTNPAGTQKISDNARVRQLKAGVSTPLTLLGGEFYFRGGTLDTVQMLGGRLNVSEAVQNVASTGGGRIGQDVVIDAPPAPWAITIAADLEVVGRVPANWPQAWA